MSFHYYYFEKENQFFLLIESFREFFLSLIPVGRKYIRIKKIQFPHFNNSLSIKILPLSVELGMSCDSILARSGVFFLNENIDFL